jgi:hypothetical protein
MSDEVQTALRRAANYVRWIDDTPGVNEHLNYFELQKIIDFAGWLEELAARQ